MSVCTVNCEVPDGQSNSILPPPFSTRVSGCDAIAPKGNRQMVFPFPGQLPGLPDAGMQHATVVPGTCTVGIGSLFDLDSMFIYIFMGRTQQGRVAFPVYCIIWLLMDKVTKMPIVILIFSTKAAV